MKFGLIGGEDIKKYTIADYLWYEISRLSGIKFSFEVIPLASKEEVCKFYWGFLEDKDFLGFNVALPWKNYLTNLVDYNDPLFSFCPFINTVYKRNNFVSSTNTDPLGVVNSLMKTGCIEGKKVLILGVGGAGYSTALFLTEKYHCEVYIFDILAKKVSNRKLIRLKSYNELLAHKYDVIINASPVGKYYLGESPKMFSTPLRINMLERIVKSESIVQEMNYFPLQTELLSLSVKLGLRVISGTEMLTYQALESFKKYVGQDLDEEKKKKLINFMNGVSYEKEQLLLKGTFTGLE